MPVKIPLMRPYFNSDELKEVEKVLSSGWVTSGPKVKEFEKKIATFLGIKYAIAVVNCTAGLHLSLLSLGIKKGDEVIVADFTYPATGHAVMYCGATPRFVDVNHKTYNIEPNLIKGKITKKTKGIIPVHTFGQPAKMDEILDISRSYNIPIIEDAACALGSKYKNRYAGTFGNISCFSFHARKGITTGEGGMVVTNDKELAENIRELSIYGIGLSRRKEKMNKIMIDNFEKLGFNYKMSDITAAVGIGQLKKINKFIKQRRSLAKYWDDRLIDLKGITQPNVEKDAYHIYQSYVSIIDDNINRNKIIGKLLQKGVQTQIGTYALHIQPVYGSTDKCQSSLRLFNQTLALPLYYNLTENEIDKMTKIIKNILEETR